MTKPGTTLTMAAMANVKIIRSPTMRRVRPRELRELSGLTPVGGVIGAGAVSSAIFEVEKVMVYGLLRLCDVLVSMPRQASLASAS
jgi:hypothetical protein